MSEVYDKFPIMIFSCLATRNFTSTLWHIIVLWIVNNQFHKMHISTMPVCMEKYANEKQILGLTNL